MNMRWGWTLPMLSALAATWVTGPVQAQGQPGGAPVAMPQAFAPQGMYAPAAAYPQPMMYPVPPAAYAAAAQAGAPAGAIPDVNGSYGYLPVEFAAQPHLPPGAAAAYAAAAYAQPPSGPAVYGQPGYGPPMSSMMDQGGFGAYAGGYGTPDGMGGGPIGGGPMGGGMDGPCQYCGGQGCPQCLGGAGTDGTWMPNGLLGDILGLVAPYPDGGCAAPRWYDFAVDYMMLKRDNTGFNQEISRFGGPGGPTALQTNNIDFGSYKPGFRFSAALQIAAANSLEFTYFGMFNYVGHATARAAGNNLFSVFSNFGLGPFGGFTEFDQANFQQIVYQSSFDSFETNWRCRWMAPNCRYQGSWLIGVRHFILNEKFRFFSQSGINGMLGPTSFIPAQGRDDTDTTNDLTGLQIGGDTWICLLPGLRAGAELQAGVYGNHIGVNTTIGSNMTQTQFREHLADNNVAFLGQINLLTTYRINYNWSLRGGYQFLYVSGVALAPENFNPVLPFINDPFRPRVTHVADSGFVFYHGWNVGVEYMW